MQAGLLDALVIKDYSLDIIAWTLVNIVLENMIRSTTAWINSGFEGEPAFITDMDGWLTDIADRVAGDFIWNNTNLAFLCSPFALDVKFALDLQYRQSRDFETECRITEVVDNFDAFLAGDFLAGGWDGWFDMTLNRGSNPYGAALEASIALLGTPSAVTGTGPWNWTCIGSSGSTDSCTARLANAIDWDKVPYLSVSPIS